MVVDVVAVCARLCERLIGRVGQYWVYVWSLGLGAVHKVCHTQFGTFLPPGPLPLSRSVTNPRPLKVCHRCLTSDHPPYLTGRRLRSASTALLVVPRTYHSTIGDRAFPVAAARVWNSIASCHSVVVTDVFQAKTEN